MLAYRLVRTGVSNLGNFPFRRASNVFMQGVGGSILNAHYSSTVVFWSGSISGGGDRLNQTYCSQTADYWNHINSKYSSMGESINL